MGINNTLNKVFFEEATYSRFEKHFASKVISSRELEQLSVKILLEQSPSDLLRFLERAETTIINSERSNKSLQLISLLIQVHKKLDDYILAEIAGNTQAKKVNRSLDRILNSMLSKDNSDLEVIKPAANLEANIEAADTTV